MYVANVVTYVTWISRLFCDSSMFENIYTNVTCIRQYVQYLLNNCLIVHWNVLKHRPMFHINSNTQCKKYNAMSMCVGLKQHQGNIWNTGHNVHIKICVSRIGYRHEPHHTSFMFHRCYVDTPYSIPLASHILYRHKLTA